MITTHQFVSDFVDDLAAQGVTFTDDTALKTALEDRFNQWLDSPDAVPANLAQRLAYSIGLFQSDILGRYDFWTLTATGGPHGDGTFDVAMPDGTTVPFPSLAKLEDEVSTLGGLTPLVDAAAASATLAENYAQKDDGYAASTDNSAKSWAIGGTSTGYPAAGPAKDWATKTGAAVVTGAYSAKEWSVGTFTIGAAAGGSAKAWATYTGGVVDDADFSSKAYAVGSPTAGCAKDWAQKTGGAVITGAYSAKEWSVGTFLRGAASGGSAKDWATYQGGVVDNAEFSAKAYAVGAPTAGSAKDWATKTSGEVVSGQGYGALKYANDAAASASAAFATESAVGLAAANVAALVPNDVFVKGHTPVTGSNASSGTYIFGQPFPAQTLSIFKVWGKSAGDIKLKRFTRVAQTFTFVEEWTFTLASGVDNVFLSSNSTLPLIVLNEGDYLGVYSASGSRLAFNTVSAGVITGVEYIYDASDLTTTKTITYSVVPSTGARIEVYFEGIAPQRDTAACFATDLTAWGATYTLGVDNPASSGATILADATYVEDIAFIQDSILTAIDVYARLATNMMVFIFARTAAGAYSVAHKFCVYCPIGRTTLVKDTDFPSGLIVSAGGLIGFRPLVASAIDQDTFQSRRYRTINGDPADPVVAFDGFLNSKGVQIKFSFKQQTAVRKIADRRARIIDQVFDTAIPLDWTATNWSISSGKAVPSSTGLANRLTSRLKASYSATSHQIFEFAGGSDEIAIFREPYLTPTAITLGTIVTINASTGLFAMRAAWDGSNTLPAVQISKTSTITFTTGRKYRLDIQGNGRIVLVTLRDMITGLTDTLTSNALTSVAGYAQGGIGFAAIAGAPPVYSASLAAAVHDPLVMIFGDSISQGTGSTTNANGWAQQVAAACRGMVSAHSGETSANAYRRVEDESRQFHPAYVLILSGTNDTSTSAWQANIDNMARNIRAIGAVPVFGTIPAEVADSNPETVMNPYLRSSGYRLIEFDRALTTGGTGLSADRNATLYFDTLHPNDAGHAAMFARVKLDLPELFDLAGVDS